MKIQIGIASTTYIDRQGDKMSKGCLEGMAEQINSKYIPQLVEHDFNNQVGINLYGEVFSLPDGEFGLGVVIGIFENDNDKISCRNYEKNLVFLEYQKYLNTDELVELFLMNTSQNKQNEILDNEKEYNVALLLERFLNSTSISPDGKVYTVKHFIAETNNLKIEVYPKDHYPPHFHVTSKNRELNARFDLETFEYINTKSGKITNKQIKHIQSFLYMNPKIVEELKTEYCRLQG